MADKEESIAHLIEDSQDMIRRFEALVDRDRIETVGAPASVPPVVVEPALEPVGDGYFDLFVEDDAMTAVAEFRPPGTGGQPLLLEHIEQAFVDKGVVHGLDWDAIDHALQGCNLDLRLQTGVVVARGTPPRPFVPEHLALEPNLVPPPPEVDAHRDVDFKEISPFIVVKQGQTLARRVAEVPGSPGVDLRGTEVPFPTAPVESWTAGSQVIEAPEGLQAAIDGRLVLQKPVLSVSPVLELKEGVDYRTGNIRFSGEVVVYGKVAAGFSIEARSLTATDTLDVFHTRVEGDLSTPGGLIGNGPGRLEAGGTVRAKFLEHVLVIAQGDVLVETALLESVVKTRGRLLLGDKGIVAGGQVHSLGEVNVRQLGIPSGLRTDLFVGLDFAGMERIVWLRERGRELQAQLKRVETALPYAGARTPELVVAAKKLQADIAGVEETARVQLLNLGQDEEAGVTVRGVAHPGVNIEICHVSFQVTQKLTAVRFWLDKRKGSIAVTPLTAENLQSPFPGGAANRKH